MKIEKDINQVAANTLLEQFVGCDSDTPGNPESPAVWLFGIEHGNPGKVSESEGNTDNSYSIDTQLRWHYNQNAFKLLAAMSGHPSRGL